MTETALRQPRTKVPDPEGFIARIRSKLNPQCAVRLSPFCDLIIAMRMQGVDFRGIEKWLIKQGDHHRISAATICRNLQKSKVAINLTYAEEMLEKLGGQVEIDLIAEMSKTIWTQKQRVDMMVRDEIEKRKAQGYERYADRRIRHELEIYNEMLRNLHAILQEIPAKAAAAAQAEQQRLDAQGVTATPDALAVLRDLILNDELQIGAAGDVPPAGVTKH